MPVVSMSVETESHTGRGEDNKHTLTTRAGPVTDSVKKMPDGDTNLIKRIGDLYYATSNEQNMVPNIV